MSVCRNAPSRNTDIVNVSASAECAWLTTLRADGSPHTTPVWFVLVDGTFWIASAARNRKVKNLASDPRVSIAIDGSTAQPRVAQGRARTHTALTDHPVIVERFAQKYCGWDATDESQDGPRVLIEVPVERWLLGGLSP